MVLRRLGRTVVLTLIALLVGAGGLRRRGRRGRGHAHPARQPGELAVESDTTPISPSPDPTTPESPSVTPTAPTVPRAHRSHVGGRLDTHPDRHVGDADPADHAERAPPPRRGPRRRRDPGGDDPVRHRRPA